MKKAARILGIVFLVLTIAGAVYVISHGGTVSPGYAVIPGLFCIVCAQYSRGGEQSPPDKKRQ